MKKCPFCAEEIMNSTITCNYCGEDLPILEIEEKHLISTKKREGYKKNILKKILFPFTTEKYKSLESKWWHRLIKIFFIAILIFGGLFIFSIINIKENIYNTIEINNLSNFTKENPELINSIPEFFKNYGKFSCIKNNKMEEIGFHNLGKSICNSDFSKNIDKVIRYIKNNIGYEDLSDEGVKVAVLNKIDNKLCLIETSVNCDKIILYQRNILFYIEISIEVLSLVYLINIIGQLIYFKGIIYIIYGNKKENIKKRRNDKLKNKK